jgi:hypothetical protein
MTLRLRRSPQKSSTFNVTFYRDLSFIDNPLYSEHLNLGESVDILTPVPWHKTIRSVLIVCVTARKAPWSGRSTLWTPRWYQTK